MSVARSLYRRGPHEVGRRSDEGGIPPATVALVATSTAVLVGAAALVWRGDLTAAAAVDVAFALALCGCGALEALLPARPLLTPLAAVATAQAVLLATPLPLLTPGERLGIQGLLLWVVVAGAQRATFPRPLIWREPLNSASRITQAAGRSARDWRLLVVVAAIGVGVGVVAAALLPFHAITRTHGTALLEEVVAASVVFSTAEEYLFRGLVAPALGATLGSWALPFDAIVFASAYGGSRQWPLLLLIAACGAGASWITRRFETVAPTVVAHAVAVVTLILLLPHRFA